MDLLPLYLSDACISLYPADAAGNPMTAAPIWFGALATGLTLRRGYDEELSFASGDAYKTARHVDETHIVELKRVWFIQKTAAGNDANPQRNTSYVLDMVWTAPDELNNWYFYSRRYFGVTARTLDLNSAGTKSFEQPLVLRAQYFTTGGGQSGGPTPAPPVTTPPANDVLFVKENPLILNDYLLGNYIWSATRTILTAEVTALAPQGANTVLTLEIGGTLTGHTLTLTAGAANTPVSASTNIGLVVAAGNTIRWKVTSGPTDAENAAWQAGVVMEVQ